MLLLLPAVPSAKAESSAAEDLTNRCSFDFGTYRDAKNLVLHDAKKYQTFHANASFSLTWEEPLDGARLCLQWQTLPEKVVLFQYDANGALLRRDTLPSYYETVTPLLSDARSALVQAGEQGMRLLSASVYGKGDLPDPYHEWQETPDRLDYLLISTHPDDDVLYLGSVIPNYGAERGYVGTVVYVTASSRGRVSEAENGAWAMGLRYRPVFLGMQDVGRYVSKKQKEAFPYQELVRNFVRLYRSLHPVVVFAQDLKGEYGHWQHKLTAKASREAFALAADPSYDPESAERYGTWQVQKLFLHLYKENKLLIDAHTPLTFFGGASAYQVAVRAYKKHVSQQIYHFKVTRDDKRYAFNRFGMAEGVVPVGEDVFDNIDETLLSDYVPPTPQPTERPTQDPTPDATKEPVSSAAEPTPKPTDAPVSTVSDTPQPEQKPQSGNPQMLVWIAAVTAALAIVVWIAAFLFSKGYLKRIQQGRS